MPKIISEASESASSFSNSTSKSRKEKRKQKIGQNSKEKTNIVPSSTVEEIVKRYSMQSSKSDNTEQLSEECLAEISALEETFQELESFELQVEKIKDEVQINSANEEIGNKNTKHNEEKHLANGQPMVKAEEQKIKQQNSEKKNLDMESTRSWISEKTEAKFPIKQTLNGR